MAVTQDLYHFIREQYRKGNSNEQIRNEIERSVRASIINRYRSRPLAHYQHPKTTVRGITEFWLIDDVPGISRRVIECVKRCNVLYCGSIKTIIQEIYKLKYSYRWFMKFYEIADKADDKSVHSNQDHFSSIFSALNEVIGGAIANHFLPNQAAKARLVVDDRPGVDQVKICTVSKVFPNFIPLSRIRSLGIYEQEIKGRADTQD